MTVKAFDFKIDIHGAAVVPARERLSPACLSDQEIDANIRLLKADLDAVAKRMKRAVRKQQDRPIFEEAPDA